MATAVKLVYLAGLAIAAVVFWSVGRWGRRNADDLVPAARSAAARERKLRSLRRGAALCHVLAAACAALVVVYLMVY
ncbi:hypothetical protein HFP15_15270 [Amycolatopsis sp. K13G38]|uniref:Uncharacterized protein n=1 Tax=Amycolatopsis acididurans TaxID=2724524 RepID=A0ABX1J3A2_9PSEU|nr:hypothetical protein [Amycolatopsis acididurans]NKQ54248.1 hypothetical protein [Amycolatopsis acididurans]